MDELVIWLIMVLEEDEERVQRYRVDGHDPRRDLARIQAERGHLHLWAGIPQARTVVSAVSPQMKDSVEIVADHMTVIVGATLRWIAYGRRFDAPGWQDHWAPEFLDLEPPA